MESTVNRRQLQQGFLAIAGTVVATLAHAQATVSGNAFNPALSLILDGKWAHYSQDDEPAGMAGFLVGTESGLPPRGLSLGESELVASANVDDKFYGQLTLAIASTDAGTELGVEEAFLQTTALENGLSVKAGRFYSEIGYLNSKHAHIWDFADQPLAYKAMLGGQFGDDGVQLRWVAPLDLLVEVGGEVYRGASFPAAGATHDGMGAWTAFAHVGGDMGATKSWRAGISHLAADPAGRESTLPGGDIVTYSGSSDLWIVDATWKWADHGNARTRNLVLQAEYLKRRERGDVADTSIDYATAILPPGFTAPDTRYRGTQQGFYLQAVYQFMPRWRVGVRYDQLRADNKGPSLGVVTPLDEQHDPRRVTAMADFSNSEFSRLRLQFANDRSSAVSDNQITLQYVMSIGAHGAHQF